MGYFEDTFSINTDSKTDTENTVIINNLRVSVLTPELIRVEYINGGSFCDLPTQCVWFRNFDSPEFEASNSDSSVSVKTKACLFVISKRNGKLKSVTLPNGRQVKNFKKGNLKGTRRTLDGTYGKVPIEDGILSKNGVALLDDSKSLVILSDGTLEPRKNALSQVGVKDYYVFAYSRDYKKAVSDFYSLTGKMPLLPRFALGNWWSRYKAYTQQEYLDLMSRFADENIPLSVATVDMDWHWVDVVGKFGKSAKNAFKPKNISEFNQGWTGYSWNTDLFPDYKSFLKSLKDRGLHITVNLHPSMGVRWFDDIYDGFAGFMGIAPKSKKQIEFDLSDKKFIEGYFKFLHHPYEKDGVDFWWIDWQQGRRSQVEGLDPLWALNHYHSLDIKRDGKRPLILSRYAGAGSHRYPLGFSGDTAIYRSVMKFQLYFTATASNIGYSWWSHDIGGHRGGRHDEELYLRWIQFGVFSPINRLHSTSNEFMGKELWNYSAPIHHYAAEALRLRHRLIPYIYSMNYRCAFFGETLIKPMYYEHPDDDWAYSCGGQYYFGSELIVAPIFRKTDKRISAAWVDVTLPEGEFTDIFTGTVYKGGQKIRMFRDIDSIPVLAKPGAIIPLDGGELSNNCTLPKKIETLVFDGTGSFDMYEDDGESTEYLCGKTAVTHFESEKIGDTLIFSLKTQGCISLLPARREYTISFRNIASGNVVSDSDISVSTQSGYLKVSFSASPVCDITFRVDSCEPVKIESKKSRYIKAASRYSGFNGIKSLILRGIPDGKTGILTPRKLKKQLSEIDKTL